MPIIVHDAIVLEDATSAASPEAGVLGNAPSFARKKCAPAVPATSAASSEAGAVPAPSQTAEVDAVPAPEEVAQVVAPPLQVDVVAAGDDDLVVAPLEGGN
ncbi:hypothetical protein H257_17053 [Aphanomyces astaci]|uniref:Uncharacterized protein n=1 Tax=Aphanomyces astaci TaxID=112090 RepID=W4FG26_APHAT|nr:hypothetical protein H257_17053 [Aphanomyces astaci]ETV66467.1 hypothetical protein H257_17053 [Aphanomyces astaci]|eukprot:XP_009843996.1 hypothetical protein H257_17053 [Aphanomyces astaci]